MKFELATRNHAALTAVVESLVEQNIASRIAAKDHTLWGQAAESEASIRLGWVTSAQDSVALIPEILELPPAIASLTCGAE